jgi:reverse transcriptase-like protein
MSAHGRGLVASGRQKKASRRLTQMWRRFTLKSCVMGAGGEAFDINEIRKNIPAFVRWNREFEIPDVIGYADFQLCSALFATDAARTMSASCQPDKLLKFQYPNFNPNLPGKVRRFAIAQPIDQLILRYEAGRIVEKLDSILSDRVCSFRLDGKSKEYLPWTFHSKQESWQNLTNRSIAVLRGGRYSIMCRTDVRNYYPSVKTEILEKLLRDLSCETSAVRRILQVLEYWQRVEGLNGLPIGVEASAVLGNVFLEQVDRGLIEAGGSHFRFADDIFIFAENRSIGDALVNVLDDKLRMMGLERSLPKTQWFDNPNEAISSLRKPWLASLGGVIRSDPELRGKRALRFAFDRLFEDVSQTDPSEYRFILNALKSQKDDYGCSLLASNAELTNVDPRASAEYLTIGMRTGQANRTRVIEACMTQLRRTSGDESDGFHLHLLRGLASTPTGQSEGNTFQEIAMDGSRPWPVRNFAWHAFAQGSACRDSLLMEAAREEQEPNVRRAIIATLKTSKYGKRTQRKFLHHAARKFPESRFTVEWVRRAA